MRTRNGRRTGFTLVELLVVISIIGMLMAMLLPAVQSARESGRANTCRNNMRNVALALAQYDGQKNQLPGYEMTLRTSVQTPVTPTTASPVGTYPGNDRRSWIFALLPFLDKRALYDDLRTNDTVNNDATIPNLEVLICPSNPIESKTSIATNFVANCGQVDGTASATRGGDYPSNGVFHTGVASPVTDRVHVTGLTQIGNSDGQGTTLLLSENADAGSWTAVSASGTPGERWVGFGYHTDDGQPGVYNAPTAVGPNPMAPNARFGESKASGTILSDTGYLRPSAYHPGGFNVVFADSHVRFMSDSMSYGVFQALCTPRGASAYYASGASSGTLLTPTTHAARGVKIDETSY